MLLRRVWFYLRGYVLILVRGPYLEKFLNLALSYGIRLWDVRRAGADLLTCKVGVQGFKKMRPVLRKAGCRARIRRRVGFVFMIRRVFRRPVLFAGLLAFVCLIYILSGRVWFIEVRGLSTIRNDEIGIVLRDLGISPGRTKSSIDIRGVENELVNRLPGLAWSAVRLRGTVAMIEVVEKDIPPAPEVGGDIIAARDGIIEQLLVFKGYACVSEGDTVHRGDVLISGKPPLQSGTPAADIPSLIPEGTVEARVWYRASATVSRRLAEWEATGRRAAVHAIRIGSIRVVLGKVPKYAAAATTTQRRQWFSGRNGRFFIEIVSRRFSEVTRSEKALSRSEAVRAAMERAWKDVRRRMDKEALSRVHSRQHRISETKDAVTVELFVGTIQAIGVTRLPTVKGGQTQD